MTPRGTDWGLASLVALGFATGALTLFAGAPGDAWVFTLHAVAGFALAGLLAWKLPRVVSRLSPTRWDARTAAGAAAVALVAGALGSGWLWSNGARPYPAGYSLLAWHEVLGATLGILVLAHAAARAKRPRRRDLADRRQFLIAAGVGAASFTAWRLQRPVASLLGWGGAHRRFTGSYEAGSFQANAFPTTSWVSDHPRALPPDRYRLRVEGLVDRPLTLSARELDAGDLLEATLDCTGGFYSTQRWRGIRLQRLLDRAGLQGGASHVRVVSHTGYRWTWSLGDADRLLLATHVGDEPLSHEHGAPVRLVAPDHRGFQWVKWVTRIELHDGPDPAAVASTVWSSFTPEGRGAA